MRPERGNFFEDSVFICLKNIFCVIHADFIAEGKADMKRRTVGAAAFFAFVILAFGVFAGEPIRVLFVDRGHPYDEAAFDEMLASFGGELEITRAHLPEDQKLLAPALAQTTDVVLFYDQDQTPLTDGEKANYAALFDSGIGIFALHHHLSSHPEWPDYWKFIGGCYVFEQNRRMDGRELPLGTFDHDQTIDVTVVDTNHPITAGIKDFTLRDETYGGCYVSPNVHVLLSTDYEKSTPQLAWTWNANRSPVFTLMLGHDALAYGNPNFRRLVIQGLRYLRDESKKVR